MATNPEPGKLRRQAKILLLCLAVLAGLYYVQQQSDPDVSPLNSLFPGEVNHKQDLRNKYAAYREGRISAQEMLDACASKLMYAEKGKDALAEYAYALRSQAYLDEGDPEAALAEARKAADIAPSPGRGAVALGDALRALGRNEEAAGAYRQALRNPGYVPEYTMEDPMSPQTLDALFLSDAEVAKFKDYENTVVRGQLRLIEIAESGNPTLRLNVRYPEQYVFCHPEEYNYIFKNSNLIDSYVVEITQTLGLSFTIRHYGRYITIIGNSSHFGPFTFMEDCVILKIER